MQLIDFIPHSKLQTKSTLVQKPRFQVIDAHNHINAIFNPSETLSGQELLEKNGYCWRKGLRGFGWRLG